MNRARTHEKHETSRHAGANERRGARGASVSLFSSRHDLPSEARGKLVGLLNQHLADTLDLYSQTKHAHWNVKGMDFIALHKLFDELAEAVETHADTLAERATALGGVANGTVRNAARASALTEMDATTTEDLAFLEALSDLYAQHAERVRSAIHQSDEIGDRATSDLFSQIARDVDKHLWLLEAHLQREPSR